MNRIVRSIFIVLVLAIVSIGSAGCIENPLGPKLDYSGQGYNPKNYDVVAYIDGEQIFSLGGNAIIRPGQYTQVRYLRGTMKHRFLVHSFPDPTIFRQEVVATIDSKSDNARLSGGVDESPDWCWVFGGSIQP